MNMVLNYLQYLGYILIFPGFLFCFVAGLLLCGSDALPLIEGGTGSESLRQSMPDFRWS